MHIKKTYVLKYLFACFLSLMWLKADCEFFENDKIYNSFEANHGIINHTVNKSIKYDASREPLYLLVENPHINKIRLKDNSGFITETGDFFKFKYRPFPCRFFVFPLNNNSSEGQVELTLDKSGENLSYRILIFTKGQLNKYLLKDQLLLGVISGIYLLGITLSFVLWLILKTHKHLFFFLYITFSFAWILNDGGILYQHIWSNSPVWHKASRSFFTATSMLLFLFYLQKNEDEFLRRKLSFFTFIIFSLVIIKLTSSILTSLNLFPEQFKLNSLSINAHSLLLLFSVIFFYLLFIIRISRKNIYEILAIQTYCVFVIAQAAKELGYLDFDILSINQFETIIFFIIQSVFMSAHLYTVEKERRIEDGKQLLNLKIQHQKEINSKIIEIEETEKKRIAQNIHDTIGSIFAAIKYRLLIIKQNKTNISAEKIENLITLTNEGIRKQYKLIDELLIDLNQENALKKAVKHYTELLISKEIVETIINWKGDESTLTDYQKSQLFHILIELITNTNKHAKASLIKIDFVIEADVLITYYDNGIGFNQQNTKTGRGLSNIKLRLDSIEGDFSISSNKQGTLVHLKIPLK